ncbi:MAG: hypothetical protein EXS35_05400 [Pedosphaera sp.]|nr:hypothetical protein [Pedosphaera sp.]
MSAPVIIGLQISRERWQRLETILDLKMLTLSAQAYARAHEGMLPETNKWCDQLILISGTQTEPALDPHLLDMYLKRKRFGYAINSLVAGRKLETIATNEIIFFPVVPKGRNLSASVANKEMLAWDKTGSLLVVDVGNSTHWLRRSSRTNGYGP